MKKTIAFQLRKTWRMSLRRIERGIIIIDLLLIRVYILPYQFSDYLNPFYAHQQQRGAEKEKV